MTRSESLVGSVSTLIDEGGSVHILEALTEVIGQSLLSCPHSLICQRASAYLRGTSMEQVEQHVIGVSRHLRRLAGVFLLFGLLRRQPGQSVEDATYACLTAFAEHSLDNQN